MPYLAPQAPSIGGESKRQYYSIHFSRLAPGIRRDKTINHLDKLNIEGKRMTLDIVAMMIRRRDNAVHCDQ